MTERINHPWYTRDAREQRCKMRNRQKTWKKHCQGHQWLAYKIERNNFNSCLRKAKREILGEKIIHSQRDTKQLYKLTNWEMGVKITKNPLPTNNSEVKMADMCADYYLNKIKKLEVT